MKTLLITEIFPPIHGGSGRWFWELYSRLARENYLIAAGETVGAEEFDKTHDLNVKRLNLSSTEWGIANKTGLRFYWKSYWALRRVIKEQKITSIHCGRCIPEGIIGLLLKKFMGVPYLCYIHGEDIETAVTSRELKGLVSWVLSNAQTLICNSQSTKNIIKKHWPRIEGKVQILHPGVDTIKFIPSPPSNTIKKRLGWPTDHQVILTVGRLQKRKGQDMMIKAMKLITKVYPKTTYAIVGDGDQMEKLKELTNELGLNKHVILLNEIEDRHLVECYQQCDIFILPNRQDGADIEGFGMVLVEAQAAGKPVIAGESGGTSETMIVNETGFVIDCTNEKEIADKIIYMLENKEIRTSMGLKATKHVQSNLNWEAHAKKAIEVFTNNLA